MKFVSLIWAGIWRKQGRTVLTLISVVNAFLLYGLLQGLAGGLKTTTGDNSSGLLITASRLSQADPLPLSLLAEIRSLPGVQSVAPVLFFSGSYQRANQYVSALAIDPAHLGEVDSKTRVPAALLSALAQVRTGALAPSSMATKFGWRVGDRVPLTSFYWINRDGGSSWPVDIVGIYPTNSDDLFFGRSLLVNLPYVDEGRAYSTGTASVFVSRAADVARAGEVAAKIDSHFANSSHPTRTSTAASLAANAFKQIADIGLIAQAVTGAVFLALLFAVGAVMMQSVNERTPELGILKTLGFTDAGLLMLILAESLLFTIFSAGIGLGLAAALFPIIRSYMGFNIHAGAVLLTGLLVAAVLAAVSGLPPALRAMRLQIVDALACR